MKTFKAVMTAFLLPGFLWAGAVPSTITYQGTIKQQGVPVNGTIPLSFRLTNSDGTQVYWSGTSSPVAVTQGMFSSTLAPTGVDWQNVSPYIEMSVNGQTLLPREPLGTGAYAFMSGGVIDGSIVTASLAAGAVTTAAIANGAVTTAQIAAGAVTTPLIAAGAVTSAQVAAAAITTPAIANAAVTTAQIAPGAVTTPLIAAGAITTPAIANGAVTTAQMANASVTANQIAAGAVTLPALDATTQGYLVPSGMVAMFTSACPGGWTRLAALDNAFPMGSGSYGSTGGSAASSTAHGVVFVSGQGSGSFWSSWQLGDTTLQDKPVSTLPPYVTVIWCQKN